MESPGGLVRQLRVSVPAERLSEAVQRRLRQVAGRAKIPGFRPGKAPMKVIEKQYGDQARMDAISDLVRETWPEALQSQDVNPVGTPEFEVAAEAAGEALVYTARFEVYPEITLADLSTLAVEKDVAEVTDEDVEQLIGNLRKARQTLEVVDRAAAEGDTVTINFIGRIDGEAFEGGTANDVEVELGSGRFLADLENGIVGHAADETFEVPVAFPEDYQAEALRGKQASFEVTLKQVREPQLPEIDDEFLAAHSVEAGAGIDGLRAKCRTALEKESGKATRNRLKAAVLDKLLEMHSFDVPKALLDQETERLREEAAARFNAAKLSPEQKKAMIPDEILAPQAVKRVSLGLLVSEVIKQRKIEVDQARVERMLDEVSEDYEQPEQVKQYYRSQPRMMQGLHAVVIEDQVVDSLLDGGKVTERSLPLQSLLDNRGGQPAA